MYKNGEKNKKLEIANSSPIFSALRGTDPFWNNSAFVSSLYSKIDEKKGKSSKKRKPNINFATEMEAMSNMQDQQRFKSENLATDGISIEQKSSSSSVSNREYIDIDSNCNVISTNLQMASRLDESKTDDDNPKDDEIEDNESEDSESVLKDSSVVGDGLKDNSDTVWETENLAKCEDHPWIAFLKSEFVYISTDEQDFQMTTSLCYTFRDEAAFAFLYYCYMVHFLRYEGDRVDFETIELMTPRWFDNIINIKSRRDLDEEISLDYNVFKGSKFCECKNRVGMVLLGVKVDCLKMVKELETDHGCNTYLEAVKFIDAKLRVLVPYFESLTEARRRRQQEIVEQNSKKVAEQQRAILNQGKPDMDSENEEDCISSDDGESTTEGIAIPETKSKFIDMKWCGTQWKPAESS